MFRKTTLTLTLVTVAVLCLLSPAANAQVALGSIKGTVADPSGASVQNAAVEVRNLGTGQIRGETTGADGLYSFPDMPAGQYEVRVVCPGFANWHGRLTLNVTQTATIPVVLALASVQSAVEVVDVTPIVNPESTDLSDVKEALRLSTIPLANRNFLNLLNLTPGVLANNYSSPVTNSYTRINGIKGGSVDYLVDGMTSAEKFTNEVQRTPQPVESIQELKVTTTDASAQYGRPGAIEILTKSGTNEFHGSLYEMYQGNRLRATPWGANFVNWYVHNEYGGNLGGPVRIPKLYNGTNRTFFFADVEMLADRQLAGQKYYSVPLPEFKKGNFSQYKADGVNLVTIYDPLTTRKSNGLFVRDPFPGNSLPSSRLNAAASKAVSYLPDPNRSVPFWQTANYQDPNARTIEDRGIYTFKIDQVIGNSRLSGRYTRTLDDMAKPSQLLNDRNQFDRGHNLALSLTHLLKPTVVNEVRAGVQRYRAFSGPKPIDPPVTTVLGLPNYSGSIAWPGICFSDNNYSGWSPTGQTFDCIDRDNPKDRPTLTTNWVDNLTWTLGRHEFRFGVFVGTNAANTFESGQPGGNYENLGYFTALQDPATAAEGVLPKVNTGIGLADFQLGYIDGMYYTTYPTFYTRQNEYAAYAQDTWKIGKDLTLTLGLRYQYWTPFRDKRDQSSLPVLSASGGPVVAYAGDAPITKQGLPQNVVDAYTSQGLKFIPAREAGLPSTLWNMQKTNFAPRLGLAWRWNEKTVVRGAYGTYYYVMPLVTYHQSTRKNPPFTSFSYYMQDDNDPTGGALAFPAGGAGFQHQDPNVPRFGADFLGGGVVSVSKGSGWAIEPWDPNYKTQKAHEWNFTIERMLPARFGMRVSYVGTRGSNLDVLDPINYPTPVALAPGVSPVNRKPYPNFAASSSNAMDLFRWAGYSNSHNFQAQVFRNFSAGSVFQAYYTFGKTLTNAEGYANAYGGLELPAPVLANNASLDDRLRMMYARDSFLPQQTFSVNGSYPLPFGKGKKLFGGAGPVLDRLVGGWQISGFLYVRNGFPFSPYFSSGAQRVMLTGRSLAPPSAASEYQYFNGDVCDPARGTACGSQPFTIKANSLDWDFRNNVPRNFMTGPGFYNVDASLFKYVPITERVRLRLDGQAFNVLNHDSLGNPGNSGLITTTVGSRRQLQVQARIEF